MARRQPRRWIQFDLESVPAGSPPSTSTTTYRWAQRPYAGEIFVEGRVPVDGWQTIERAASSMTGDYHIDSAGVTVNDADGQIRALLAAAGTRWFLNREGTFYLLSEDGWNADLEPRMLFGGRCYDAQLADNRKARIEFEDLLAPYLDRTYPQYTLGDAYPFRFELPSGDPIDEDLNLQASGYQIPIALRDQVMPIYYGPFVDTTIDPVTGIARQKGMCKTWFMGYTHLTAGTGEVGEPSPQQAALMEPFFTSAGWGGWGELFVCLGEVEVPNVYTSNLDTPPRRIINSLDYGITILAPGHPGWPFATDYVMRNGFRCTVIYARGPLLWHHITNVVNITVDVCGWPSAESPAVPIDQAGYAYQDFITQHVLAHDGAGYTEGPSVGLPLFADGRAMFWTSKIQDWQAMTALRLGDDKGYLISMALTEPTTLREIHRQFYESFDMFFAANAAGQRYIFGINDMAPTDGVAVRERIELRRLPAPRIDWKDIENEMDYTVGWDPEQNVPRTPTITIRRQDAIDAMLGEVRKKGIKSLRYTSDDFTARDVIGRKLLRLSEAPRFQPLPVRTDGVDREIGEQVRVSHRDGFGSPDVGYDEQPMLIMRHAHEDDDITLTALDLQIILDTSVNAPAITGGGGWDWETWP